MPAPGSPMLRGLWTSFMLAVMTVVCGVPVLVVSLLSPQRRDIVMRLGRLWSATMLRAAGAGVHYHGLERVPHDGACLFLANHQSIVDIWVLIRVLPESARFVAKSELFRIPLFGAVLSASGFIPIDREQRSEARRSLDRAVEELRRGRPLVLFPEGTRSRDGRLQPFKKGAFHLALRAGVPIVPIAIAGSHRVMPRAGLPVRPGRVDVWFEPAIEVAASGPGALEALRNEVRAVIARRLDAAAREPEGSGVPAASP